MKNYLLLLLFACILGAGAASAQKSTVHIGPGSLASSELNAVGPVIGFESILKNKTAIGLQAGLLFSNSAHDLPGRWRLLEQLLVFQPGIKWYSKEEFQGFYFGAHGNYNRYTHVLRENRTGEKAYNVVTDLSDSFIGFGVDLGFSTSVMERFVFGIGLSTDLYIDYTRSEYGALGLGLGARFGYRF